MLQIAQTAYAQALYDNKIITSPTALAPNAMAVVLQTVQHLLALNTVLHKPTGADVAATTTTQAPAAGPALAATTALLGHQAAGSISLVLVAESHTNVADGARAHTFLDATSQGTLLPSLVVYERGLRAPLASGGRAYPNAGSAAHPVPLVDEANLGQVAAANFGLNNLKPADRSAVVAGYLVLCLAGGDQQAIDRVVLFFGAEHGDILTDFDYIARHTTAAHLIKRPRTFLTISPNP